jgi:hypothetical protein
VRFRNRPLLPGSLDRNLYVSRPKLEQALYGSLRDDRNVLVVGERGSGKTTLVRRVIADSPDRDFRLVEAGPILSTQDLIRLVGRALGQDGADEQAELADDPIGLVEALSRLPRLPGAILVIDGPLDSDVAYSFFGRLRDQVWNLPNTWIVTATPDEAGALRTPPADAFWSMLLEVGNMNASEIDALLERGLDEQEREQVDAASERPISAPPRGVVRWAQDVLDGHAPTDDQQLMTAADTLGRQAAMALSELIALGRPASAGDQELLRRLGWTRANASRWLARMEDAGILRSLTGPSQGQGRPPKLYEPVRRADA